MTNFLPLTSTLPDSLSHVWQQSTKVAAEYAAQNNKFWFIDDLWRALQDVGLGAKLADLVAFIAACAFVAAVMWFLNFVVVKLSLSAINRRAKRTKSKLDDILVKRKFFTRTFDFIMLLIILKLDNIVFAGFEASMIFAFDLVVKSLLVIVGLFIIYALLNAWSDMFLLKPQAQKKSITGYVQVAKIILAFAAAILAISILAQKDPSNLFVGLGATAALFSLVFKDTILGFVASIQLSAQDMVRPGDWIEMPSKGADGTVLEMNVNSVKVQNWDNTITMIPIYAMVSDSFTNWRGMEQSSGRRFVRYIYVNMESVKFVDDEFLERLAQTQVISANADEFIKLSKISSPENLTNLALFRAAVEVFLRAHAEINDELPLYVRYKQEISDKGIGVEIYAFSKQKDAQKFDAVHRSVVEYVVAIAPLFDIELFQSPSGTDFQKLMGA